MTPGKGHRAFSAGGDVVDFYKAMTAESPKLTLIDKFNLDEYRLHLRLALEDFFQISIWDGIVMGSGVGVSIHS